MSERQTYHSNQATLLMASGGLLLGTIGIFVANTGQSPLAIVFYRCLFGCLALLAWAYFSGKINELKLSKSQIKYVSIIGVFMVIIWSLYFYSLRLIPIGISTLVFHIQAFWVLILGAVFFKEKITLRSCFILTLALLGLALSTGLLNGSSAGFGLSNAFLKGIGICILGSFFYAVTTLIAKLNTGISSLSLTWWQCAVGALVTAWVPFLKGWPLEFSAWAWLIGIGVIHSGLAFTLIYQGISRLSTSRIAVLQFVYPGTAILIDWAVYDHALSFMQWVGVMLIAYALWALRKA